MMSRSENKLRKKSPTSGKVLGPPMFNIKIPVFAGFESVVAVRVWLLLFNQRDVIIFIIPLGRDSLGFKIIIDLPSTVKAMVIALQRKITIIKFLSSQSDKMVAMT